MLGAVDAGCAVTPTPELAPLVRVLSAAGCVAAEDEARDLLQRAGGDRGLLAAMVDRRRAGEPLAWITGAAAFCGLSVAVSPGVFVPRPQSEALARRAAARLPASGVAVDLCTGAGAIALFLARARPGARVVGTDLDPAAVACAVGNTVVAHQGDLFEPLPPALAGRVDVVVGVVPYVPTAELRFLPRDARDFEPKMALDGGPDGTDVLRRAIAEAPRWLRPGGHLLLELGADEAELLVGDLDRAGFTRVERLHDEDGDVRGIEALLSSRTDGGAAGY